ncbi:hypothetical protein BA059_22030 [Mycolicibacterium sp. (ex Dasyatis americana)]|uniref:Secreted protein n=2 Tax=Mycobacteriaceae TaxID=1762 RepID=A0A1Q9W573_9MYCO|nr:hypothetical protein BA059_22030 [Mycolicibacterium sp. (ex Dasyatis americana)]OHU00007.1 hypothetical protein BKG61_12745 [Mycobacterium syngnathidarum]OLT90163.1 hypothetical protein BKG60_24555 [Mycobacterium syngnathidarum]TMS49684.1 hypothetical protein E0T84_25780 [Mycobacterium sp. DBP42]
MLAAAAATALAAGAVATAAPAFADDPPPPPGPPLHHVQYTVTTDAPYWVHIYYRDSEPAIFSDYSHNPYQFSPRVDVDVAPDKPWVLDTMLADPDLWAMVLVQSGESPNFPTPGFNCKLAVDGVVVKTDSGPKGALCSIRNW